MNILQDFSEPYIIKRLERDRYCLWGVEDEIMSRRQLDILMHKILRFEAEELAFMYLEFKENPEFKLAYFGVNGKLLYCK